MSNDSITFSTIYSVPQLAIISFQSANSALWDSANFKVGDWPLAPCVVDCSAMLEVMVLPLCTLWRSALQLA
jgi:hypothetical protein